MSEQRSRVRARARARVSRALREARLAEICRLMAANRWKTGQTGEVLAKEWGVSPRTVGAWACEASRLIRETGSAERMRLRICVALDAALDDAQGDPRAVAAVAKTWAAVLGIGGPIRLEHSGPGGAPLTLPPVLAALLPPPTLEEVERFVATGEVPRRPPELGSGDDEKERHDP